MSLQVVDTPGTVGQGTWHPGQFNKPLVVVFNTMVAESEVEFQRRLRKKSLVRGGGDEEQSLCELLLKRRVDKL